VEAATQDADAFEAERAGEAPRGRVRAFEQLAAELDVRAVVEARGAEAAADAVGGLEDADGDAARLDLAGRDETGYAGAEDEDGARARRTGRSRRRSPTPGHGREFRESGFACQVRFRR
jgi:hypothetical protein